MITGNQHPTILIAKMDNFSIVYVLSFLTFIILEPFRKSLHGESCCS